MRYFVFRNHTIEPFFDAAETSFSGYGDVSIVGDADRYVWFYLPSYKTDMAVLSQEIDSYLDLLKITLSRIEPDRLFLIFSIQAVYKIRYENSDFRLDDAIENYNKEIRRLGAENPNVRIIDIADFFAQTDVSNAVDWRFYFISQMPLNPKLAPLFKQWFSDRIRSIELKRKKCMVLDLDNTLWGGILGEDGIHDIQLGETYPGSAYAFFQKFLLDLSRQGVLLTICSKNNEQDVWDAFEQNPSMILKKEHFVAYRINWNNKADNIKEIAEELNIGLDSLVFVDDNPAERELVKQMIPLVEIPDFPKHPYLYPAFAQTLTERYFSVYTLTNDDKSKTQQYKDNAARAQFKSSFSDFNDYIKSLNIELSFEKMSDFNITRFAQMTQKTNQFNLTTKRYVETDLKSLETDGALIYGMRVSDKFGDNGLTGLMIVSINNKVAEIDSLLLSCRILGKNIECELVKHIISKLIEYGITEIRAAYIKTPKNMQVEDFYEKLNFTLIKKSKEEKKYTLQTENFEYIKSTLYKIKEI